MAETTAGCCSGESNTSDGMSLSASPPGCQSPSPLPAGSKSSSCVLPPSESRSERQTVKRNVVAAYWPRARIFVSRSRCASDEATETSPAASNLRLCRLLQKQRDGLTRSLARSLAHSRCFCCCCYCCCCGAVSETATSTEPLLLLRLDRRQRRRRRRAKAGSRVHDKLMPKRPHHYPASSRGAVRLANVGSVREEILTISLSWSCE